MQYSCLDYFDTYLHRLNSNFDSAICCFSLVHQCQWSHYPIGHGTRRIGNTANDKTTSDSQWSLQLHGLKFGKIRKKLPTFFSKQKRHIIIFFIFYVDSVKTEVWYRGSFNNHVDKILTIFDHPPTSHGQTWTFPWPPTFVHVEIHQPTPLWSKQFPFWNYTSVISKKTLCEKYCKKPCFKSLG